MVRRPPMLRLTLEKVDTIVGCYLRRSGTDIVQSGIEREVVLVGENVGWFRERVWDSVYIARMSLR